MKLHVILAAAAVALGSSAFAADTHRVDNDRDQARTEHSQPTAGQKLRDTMHRIGNKTRNAFHRAENKVEKTARHDDEANDTRRMGDSGSMTDSEHARRQRMDDAYDNWRQRQQR
jgi:hypothetical protein